MLIRKVYNLSLWKLVTLNFGFMFWNKTIDWLLIEKPFKWKFYQKLWDCFVESIVNKIFLSSWFLSQRYFEAHGNVPKTTCKGNVSKCPFLQFLSILVYFKRFFFHHQRRFACGLVCRQQSHKFGLFALSNFDVSSRILDSLSKLIN